MLGLLAIHSTVAALQAKADRRCQNFECHSIPQTYGLAGSPSHAEQQLSMRGLELFRITAFVRRNELIRRIERERAKSRDRHAAGVKEAFNRSKDTETPRWVVELRWAMRLCRHSPWRWAWACRLWNGSAALSRR